MITLEESEAIATRGRIYLAVVGSTAAGLALEGATDRDEMGVCIEPPEYVIGLKQFEQHQYRDRAEGERSQHGDREGTIYSLRKFCRLALNGNPSILTSLYAPEYEADVIGQDLRDNADWFSTKKAGKAFLGYMLQQRQRLVGERGQKNVKRPELVQLFGFDTKYAFQILRLGFQGVELLETGCLKLPMSGDERTLLIQVRRGNVNLNEVIDHARSLESQIKEALVTTGLPDEPNYERVNEWLVGAYQYAWPDLDNPFGGV